MFTSILAFLSPYKLIIKGIALVLIVIASYAYYVHFKHSLIAIGRTEVQLKWDKYTLEQDKLLQAAITKNITLRAAADKNLADLKIQYDKNLAD